MAFAVIDLGTNTFHLLVAEIHLNGFRTIYRKRHSVKLGRDGLDFFSEQVIEDAKEALINFKSDLEDHPTANLKIIGTSAMRTSSNADQLIEFIEEKFDTGVDIVNGEREAELIFKGVKHNYNSKLPSLIMDIGGGSIEFIAFEDQNILHLESIPIGISVLYNTFKFGIRASIAEQEKARFWLESKLQRVREITEAYKIKNLIGASGTFDLLKEMFPHPKHSDQIAIQECLAHLDEFIGSTLEERKASLSFPEERLDYVPVAYLLVKTALNLFNPDQLYYSPNSLKEGVLVEMTKA